MQPGNIEIQAVSEALHCSVDPETNRLLYIHPEGDRGSIPRGQFLAHYLAGYAAGSVPADLRAIAAQVADSVSAEFSKDKTLKSEKIGDYSYTLADMAQKAVMGNAEALAPFANISF